MARKRKRFESMTEMMDFFRKTGSEGGRKRAANLTAEQQSAIGRRAAASRWGKKIKCPLCGAEAHKVRSKLDEPGSTPDYDVVLCDSCPEYHAAGTVFATRLENAEKERAVASIRRTSISGGIPVLNVMGTGTLRVTDAKARAKRKEGK